MENPDGGVDARRGGLADPVALRFHTDIEVEAAQGSVDETGAQACAGAGYAGVLVPHNQGGGTEPVLISAESATAGTSLTWDPVRGALSYRVARGNVSSLKEAGDFGA